MIEVPATPEEITPAWLGSALDIDPLPAGSLTITRIGQDYGFASHVFRVELAEATPASVVVKLWSRADVRQDRELQFYGSLGRGAFPIRIPRCHRAAMNEERGVLVMEDMRGATQGDCLDVLDAPRALGVAGCIARLHARWWGDVDQTSWLASQTRVSRDPDWFSDRPAEFRKRFGDQLQPGCAPLLEPAKTVHDRANELLRDAPEALIHGDLHLDNLLFADNGEPVFLDWANVARGPGAVDLVEVLFMTRPRSAPDLVAVYHKELAHQGVAIDPDDLNNWVTGALLRRFLSYTYGTVRWFPETERQRAVQLDSMRRVQEAVLSWKERYPEQFAFLGRHA